jgi:hypothetical protein
VLFAACPSQAAGEVFALADFVRQVSDYFREVTPGGWIGRAAKGEAVVDVGVVVAGGDCLCDRGGAVGYSPVSVTVVIFGDEDRRVRERKPKSYDVVEDARYAPPVDHLRVCGHVDTAVD